MAVRDDIMPESLTEPQTVLVERVMGQYLDAAKNLETDPRLKPGERSWKRKDAKDIDYLPELIQDALTHAEERSGIPESHRIKFREDFAPQDLTTELITYGLLSRDPATISGGKHLNQQRQEWKPRIRGVFDSEKEPGQKVIQLGQKFENVVLFTCWAQTNKAANKRARWLEDILRAYTWYLKYNGMDEFYFIGQDEDITVELESTEHRIVGRPMRYFVRTERLSTIEEAAIRHMTIKFGLSDQ